ncbi:hypothetical protein M8C21_027113, partial [Ambrosia artemisiifolia]
MYKESWNKLGKVLKERFGLDLTQKQMKNAYDNLKAKYIGWVYLKNKTGNMYNTQTNTFSFTNEGWEEFKKGHPKAGSLKIVPLPFQELCAESFDDDDADTGHQTFEPTADPTSEPTPEHTPKPNPKKKAKISKSSISDDELARDMQKALQYLIKGKEGPTVVEQVVECSEKLKLVGLNPVDPLFLAAYHIFGVSSDMRAAWMALPEIPEVLKGWIVMTSASLGLITICWEGVAHDARILSKTLSDPHAPFPIPPP